MLIADLLVMTHGNQSEVARMLNVQRSTVRRFLFDTNNHIVRKQGEVYSLFTRIGG